MIPVDPDRKTSMLAADATLDDLFRRAAARRPDALALIDPPNREAFTDSPPCRLTYAQADRIVTAMARRLRQMGLNSDAIVGLQLANSVEGVLTLLAVLRAGLIAMPLPLLWRRAEERTGSDTVSELRHHLAVDFSFGHLGMVQPEEPLVDQINQVRHRHAGSQIAQRLALIEGVGDVACDKELFIRVEFCSFHNDFDRNKFSLDQS